jgi:16S rRNA (uracil1498-N3)-methyltransferase
MAVHDFNSQRLYVSADLADGVAIPCEDGRANYVLNVLRLREGDAIHIFNGRHGEWRAEVQSVRKRDCVLRAFECVRAQHVGPDVEYVFAPLKHARLDYMVQKAVEMGVRRLRPVMTRRTVAERVNLERMSANVIEAAEQCGILHIAEVLPPVKFDGLLANWEPVRTLIFCDEGAPVGSPVSALGMLKPTSPLAVLIGPEGGFDATEREALLAASFAVPISLGPRIMRADTAAVAALALVNAITGQGW